jgi:hypothetical protein
MLVIYFVVGIADKSDSVFVLWCFTGADEYDAKGLNRGWFIDQASKAHSDDPMHAIYATSWKRDGGIFPMVWSPESASVGGVNVTERYAAKDTPSEVTIGVRFFQGENLSEYSSKR